MKHFALLLIFGVVYATSDQFIQGKIRVFHKIHKIDQNIPCNLCHSAVNSIQEGEKEINGVIQFVLEQIALTYCVGKKLQVYSVCRGAIYEMTPTILESIVDRYLSADEICPYIKMCPQVFQLDDRDAYIHEVLKDKPVNAQWPEVKPNGNKVKVIHMSDLHFDLLYKEGAKAQCNQPLCCREESGKVKSGDMTAGYWGSLSDCNIPQRTLDQLFQFFKTDIYNSEDKFLIIWTGDNTPHDIWEQTKEKNLQNTEIATAMLKKYFDGVPNVQIIPIWGNHEAFPVNVFDYKTEREVEFRRDLANIWESWIGSAAADLLAQKGYYTIEPFGLNLKVIAYDSQVCNDQNWYLIKDPTDPAGFLEWFRQELYDSESKGQTVYIGAHIYTSSCLREWGYRFKALVDRFSHIIRAQIYGHAHGEGLNLYRSIETNETISVAYISSSVTTYSYRNPSFRVFQVDEETLIPLTYHQYRLYLEEANKNKEGPLKWTKAFDFIEEYGAKSMRPKDIDAVADRVLQDKELARKFDHNERSGNGYSQNPNQRAIYCDLKSSHSDERQICNQGVIVLDTESKMVELFQGKWKRRIQN